MHARTVSAALVMVVILSGLYTHAGDTVRQGGLGDTYAQVLLLPYFSRTFAFFAGTGLKVPTATDQSLGTGKWIIAPAAGPVWFLPTRGLFLVKVQNLTSFAGDAPLPASATVDGISSSRWFGTAPEYHHGGRGGHGDE
jgi:hypothetical protein